MKKLVALTLSLVLVLSFIPSAFAGEVMDHTYFSQFPLVQEGENVEVSVVTVRNAAYGNDAEKTWFWQWSEAATGLQFTHSQIIDTSLADQKPLLFASGDLPNLMMQLKLTPSELVLYGMQEHQLKDLSSYITEERMPWLSKWIAQYPQAKAVCTTPDGAMYTLPFFTNLGVPVATQECIDINTTLLQECGMEVPTSVEELTAFLYKVKELHPDSVPMSGIVGASSVNAASSGGNTLNPLSFLLNAYGYITEGTNDFGYEVALKNGKVVIPCGDADFVEFLKLANKYYTDGIMQQDFFTADHVSVTALATEHRTAILATAAYNILPTYEEFIQWQSVKPLTSSVNPVQQWKNNDSITCGGVAISADTPDELVDKILRYLDFFYSALGSVYLWEGPLYGSPDTLGLVQGLSFRDGSKYFYDVKEGPYENNLAYVYGQGFGASTAFGNRSHDIDHPEKLNYFLQMLQYCLGTPMDEIVPFGWVHDNGDGHNRLTRLENNVPYLVNGYPSIMYFSAEEQETIDEITLLLNAHVTSEVAKFITGARSIDEFDQFVSECEAYGLRELEAIYAKGYENYINAQ